MIDINDLQAVARAIWLVTNDEPVDAQIAVCCLLYNLRSVNSKLPHQPCLDQVNAALSEEIKFHQRDISAHIYSRMQPHDVWSVVANISRVWAREINDPTQGATACHLHNVQPRWAKRLTPTALIGKRFFYIFSPAFPQAGKSDGEHSCLHGMLEQKLVKSEA